MPKRIKEDLDHFIDIVSGRTRKALRKFITTGRLFRSRSKNGSIGVAIPQLDLPRIVFGEPEDGIGRGPGKPGDVIGKDPGKGKGKNGATNEHGEGMIVNVDLDAVLDELKEELQLPDLKPKPSQVLQEERIKYNSISLVGPESLRHNRKTFQQALRRSCSSGEAKTLIHRPGFVDPSPAITVIGSDKRYRQYSIIQEPSSNAVIFFARDWSGSMDRYKCDIVSDMCWWIELFISREYKRVERVYVGHDTQAEECDQKKFYSYSQGGGTNCSSAFKYMAKQFENRFPPNQWNVYVLYFTDGENWDDDNQSVVKSLKKDFGPEVANFVGITQILSWRYENSVKESIDKAVEAGELDKSIIRTTHVGGNSKSAGYVAGEPMSEETRNAEIKRAIADLLGSKQRQKAGDSAEVA